MRHRRSASVRWHGHGQWRASKSGCCLLRGAMLGPARRSPCCGLRLRLAAQHERHAPCKQPAPVTGRRAAAHGHAAVQRCLSSGLGSERSIAPEQGATRTNGPRSHGATAELAIARATCQLVVLQQTCPTPPSRTARHRRPNPNGLPSAKGSRRVEEQQSQRAANMTARLLLPASTAVPLQGHCSACLCGRASHCLLGACLAPLTLLDFSGSWPGPDLHIIWPELDLLGGRN